VEERLRAGKVSATAIAETMGLMNRAVGVLSGAAAAGKSVATDLMSATSRVMDAASTAATTKPVDPSASTSGTTGASGTGAAGSQTSGMPPSPGTPPGGATPR
jgi:hypothetical protein